MAPYRKVDRRPKRDSRTWLGGRTAFRDQKEKKESLKHPAPHSGTGSTAASPYRKVDRRPKRDSRTWLGGRTAFRDQKEKKESLKHPAPHSGTGSTAASHC